MNFAVGRRWLALGALFGVLAGACSDSPVEVNEKPLNGEGGSVASTARFATEIPAVDSLARAIAMAMNDSRIRMQLRDDLRDSPFRRHAIHLRSYLQGARGRAVLVAAAARLGMSPQRVLSELNGLPELELLMERSIDRVNWHGGQEIVVYGTTLPAFEVARSGPTQIGFNVLGAQVEIPMWRRAPFPSLVVRPAIARFGADPERVRTAAPRRAGAGISGREEESYSLSQLSCDESLDPDCCPPNVDYCEGDPSPSPPAGGVTLASQFTLYYCTGVESGPLTSATDVDGDNFRDECERELAYAFRPQLRMTSGDEAPENEPYWSATRVTNPPIGTQILLKIFYGLAYYRDPGGAFGATAHDGDSEWIVVEIDHAEGTRWILQRATLSAHFGAGWGTDQTATYGGSDLEYADTFRGRPRVYVAKDKHANYRAWNVCSGMLHDTCGGTPYSGWIQDVEYVADANLGNYFDRSPQSSTSILRNAVYSRRRMMTGYMGVEYFWTHGPYADFAGWKTHYGQPTAGAYRDILQYLGF